MDDALIVGAVIDENALSHPDLVGCLAHTVGFLHGLEHIVDEFAESVDRFCHNRSWLM